MRTKKISCAYSAYIFNVLHLARDKEGACVADYGGYYQQSIDHCVFNRMYFLTNKNVFQEMGCLNFR
jgi:hypothetical protein